MAGDGLYTLSVLFYFLISFHAFFPFLYRGTTANNWAFYECFDVWIWLRGF